MCFLSSSKFLSLYFVFIGTGLGAGTSTLGASTGGFGNVDQGTLAALKQQQMIQQQLKAIANTPFGDSPLFRNLPVSFSFFIKFVNS